MNKVLKIVLSFILLLCVCSGCSPVEQPVQDIDTLLQGKTDSENENEAEPENDSVLKDDFVSVWPDELPTMIYNESRHDGVRPIEFQTEINPGEWISEFTYESMYLYDFPDPEQFFHRFGRSFVLDKKVLHFYYDQIIEKEDGSEERTDITQDEFRSFVEVLKEAGYDENSVQTEFSYYCEKYGVGIWIVLAKDFPWIKDDERLAYRASNDVCYVRLQLIDPEYEMDLEAIKAEEYKRWLESH